jgi:hypothetical protein
MSMSALARFDKFDQRTGVRIGSLSGGAEKGMSLHAFIRVDSNDTQKPIAAE